MNSHSRFIECSQWPCICASGPLWGLQGFSRSMLLLMFPFVGAHTAAHYPFVSDIAQKRARRARQNIFLIIESSNQRTKGRAIEKPQKALTSLCDVFPACALSHTIYALNFNCKCVSLLFHLRARRLVWVGHQESRLMTRVMTLFHKLYAL